MILQQLIDKIEKVYPRHLAESWDNVGLMVGDRNADVKKILVSLEANDAVIKEAIEKGVDLIVTHHPFFFSKMNQITSDTVKGRLSMQLLQHRIAVYSMHTNYDIAFHGMNDSFCSKIGFQTDEIFLPAKCEDWYREANDGKVPGLGRICILKQPMTLEALSSYVKETLNMKYIRYVGDPKTQITRVGVITGAAADMFMDAKTAGADVLISGDMKYHEAQDALDQHMNVIDCGHFETENIFRDYVREFLEDICSLEVISSTVNLNPFQSI